MKSVFFVCLMVLPGLLSAQDSGKIKQNQQVGESLKAQAFSNIYFSGQPSTKDLIKLKQQGFATIINLRSPQEYDEAAEKKTVLTNKMAYYNFAFPGDMKLTDKYLDQVTSAIKKNRSSGKILVHCSSGNRVGMWVGGHFFRDHKYPKQKALATAKKLGLNNSKAIAKLQAYLTSK